ncbi:MAG: diguanylate cyclase [Hydrogenoanaerobacterium sp.]
MKNKTLFKTNFIVCMIIIIGFAITSVISYKSNLGIYKTDIEQVSWLTSDGIYNDISMIFSKPVSVSLTMANDSLLKSFLKTEGIASENSDYLEKMKTYLNSYRQKYNYDSVFLVSAATGYYYHYKGLDRVLAEGDPENVWYYSFLKNSDEYSLNVDNDQAKDNIITVFVNCKIKDDDGSVLGVVGVGMQVDSLQELLRSYEKEYGITAYLVDKNGTIEISSAKTGYEKINLFDNSPYAKNKDNILSKNENRQDFWYSAASKDGFVVTRYEPNLKWHLIVENDTSSMTNRLNIHLFQSILIIVMIVLLVLVTITLVMLKYNAQIVKLTLMTGVRRDSITQLYNKRATEEIITNILKDDAQHNVQHALLIFDIDNFKNVNDTMGHSFGDHVIIELADELKSQFREDDVVGRIGGDEFAVLVKNIESSADLLQKLGRICSRLGTKDVGDGQVYHVSCSIGVAFFKKDGTSYSELFEKADQALYYAKGHGKNSYAVFGENSVSRTSRVSQRDMEALLDSIAEGAASFACTEPLTLLNFNQKYITLTGLTADVLSANGYNPYAPVHPDDRERIKAELDAALVKKLPFTINFRMAGQHGQYLNIKMNGIFINELYENKYPVFYAMYTK